MSQILESPTKKQINQLHMERDKLLSSTRKYKSAIEEQVSGLKENAARWGTQALVFGGVALGTFLLIKAFSSKKKGKTNSIEVAARPSFTSTLFASIQGYIISFVLAIAREQLMAYLEKNILNKNAHSQEPTGESI